MYKLLLSIVCAQLHPMSEDLLETDHLFTDHFIRTINEPDYWSDICSGIGGGFTSVGYIEGFDNITRFSLSRLVYINEEWIDTWQIGAMPKMYTLANYDINIGYDVTHYDQNNYLVTGHVADSSQPTNTYAVVFKVNETTAAQGLAWRSTIPASNAYSSLALPNGNVIVVGSIEENTYERIAVWGLEPGIRHFEENWQWDSQNVCPQEFSGERATCCIAVPSHSDDRILVGGMNTDCGARIFVISVTGVRHSQGDFVIPGEAVRDIVALPSLIEGHDRFVALISYPAGISEYTTQRASLQVVDYDYDNEILSLVGSPIGFTPPYSYDVLYYRAQRLLRVGDGYLVSGAGTDSENNDSFIFVSALDGQFQPITEATYYYRGRNIYNFQSQFPIGLALDYIGTRIDCAIASTYRYNYTDGGAFFGYVRGIGESASPPIVSAESSFQDIDEHTMTVSVYGDPYTGYNYSATVEEGAVVFTIYDFSGRQILSEVDIPNNGRSDFSFGEQAGYYALPSGIYFVRITNEGACFTQKAVLLN